MKNITIIEEGQYARTSAGCNVRILWKGKYYRKFFSDKKYSGRPFAILAAMAWRDEKKKEIGMPVSDLNCAGKARSNTGYVGVSWDAVMERFNVTWVDSLGQPCGTSVSAQKYGYDEALEKAKRLRAEKEQWRLNGNIKPKTRKLVRKDLKKYSRDELILALLQKSLELDRVPTSRDFIGCKPATHRFEVKFGGWNKALRAAQLI